MEFISKNAVFLNLKATGKDEALKELALMMAQSNENLDAEKIHDLLVKREELSSTAIDGGLAIPHAKTHLVSHICGLLALSHDGVEFGSMDGKLTKIFFVLLSPEAATGDHLRALSQISRVFKEPALRERILQADTREEVWELITSPR